MKDENKNEIAGGEETLENEESTVVLTDDEGNEYKFILLDYVEYQEKLYALFAPEDADLDDENEELSVLVTEVAVNNEGVSFKLIEDEQITEGVIKAFYEDDIEDAE